MAKISSLYDSLDHFIGPLLDDGTPCSGISLNELKVLSPYLTTSWDGKLEPLPEAIPDHTHWQHGSGNHRIESRYMVGSIIITARSQKMFKSI